MITKYFSSIKLRFNPVGKDARYFLGALPARSLSALKMDTKLLKSNDTVSPEITVLFKDGMSVSYNPLEGNRTDMEAKFDQHSRKLKLQEDINDS